MSRFLLLYAALVLAPAALLAYFALGAASRERVEWRLSYAERIAADADALERRWEEALEDAAERARRELRQLVEDEAAGRASETVAAFVLGGRLAGFSPRALAVESDGAASEEELRRYRLSVDGGESWELARGDPEMALDAYAFYLPQLRAPSLRARLRLRIARAALAAGRRELGRRVLEDLCEDAAGVSTEEGLPVDWLAAWRLRCLDGGAAEDARAGDDRLRARLAARHALLPTRFLAAAIDAFDPENARLRRIVEERVLLERAIEEHPSVAKRGGAELDWKRERLFVALAIPGVETAEGAAVHAVAAAALSAPVSTSAGSAGFHVAIEPLERAPPGVAVDSPNLGTRELSVPSLETPVARLTLEDADYPAKLAALESRLRHQRLLVGLLVLVTLGGGAVLLWSIARARQLALLRERLLANVSHELKTPVTSIRMFSEMLAEEALDEGRVRRFGRLIHTESLRLSRVIENVLDFASARRRESLPALEPVDLHDLLRRLAAAFEFHAREKGVTFHCEGVPREGIPLAEENGAPLVVLTDAAAVERILLNLLENAVKYRHAREPLVRLRLLAGDERIAIAVEDNGVGIARKDRERVFEEFYRARFEDYGVRGDGLGLSIARRLARRLGGEITLESRLGEGSTFTLVLPRGAAAKGEVR
jgi:signal transduction histidine kinase